MRLRKCETRSSSPPAGRSSARTIEIDHVNPLAHQGPPHAIPDPPPVVGNPRISGLEPAFVGASNMPPDRLDLLARELAMPRVPNGFRKVRRGTVVVMEMAMRIDGGRWPDFALRLRDGGSRVGRTDVLPGQLIQRSIHEDISIPRIRRHQFEGDSARRHHGHGPVNHLGPRNVGEIAHPHQGRQLRDHRRPQRCRCGSEVENQHEGPSGVVPDSREWR